MSRFKFRAWNEAKKIMYSPEVDLYMTLEGELEAVNGEYQLVGIANTPQLPLMQYTGLKDCEDKEIFEGDILECKNPARIGLSVVYFYQDEYSSGFYVKDEDGTWFPILSGSFKSKVVGNIYENPKLLKLK